MRASTAVRPSDAVRAATARDAAPRSPRGVGRAVPAAATFSAAHRALERALLAGATLMVAAVGTWAATAGVDAGRLLVLLALAPLLEETAFRAGLHEMLLRRPHFARHANLLTALAFGLVHLLSQEHALAVAVAVPAWLVGLAYERWRRVRHCVALHALLNALWIAWVVAVPAWP